jgi:hypothetical protein
MAKQRINNPNKPAVKTRSAKLPDGSSVKVSQTKSNGTFYAANKGKAIADPKTGANLTEVYSLSGGKNMRETKKAISKGMVAGNLSGGTKRKARGAKGK